MKLYTKRGDAGETSLFGGQAVDKHDPRIEAIGAVDELNSFIGFAAAAGDDGDTLHLLRTVQSRLFEIGAELAAPGSTSQLIPHVDDAQVTQVERWIDQASDAVTPMKSFILPGGGEFASRLHVARTVCRRAERRCVALAREVADDRPVNPAALIYLNRLGDLLFALARRANAAAAIDDIPWSSPRRSPL